MKKALLPLLAAAALFSSCNKDDDKPKDIVLIQKIEAGSQTMTFQYNEQNLFTRLEFLEKRGDASVITEYTNITYADGVPVKAEKFRTDGVDAFRQMEITFNLNSQKRIGYAVRKYFNPDGSADGDNDTTDYSYNSDNRIIKMVDRKYPDDIMDLSYDAQGNYKLNNDGRDDADLKVEMIYDFRYDNGINPFATNGVGYILFVVYGGDFFGESMLLSTNMPTLEKEIRKYTYKNGGSNPDISETTYTDEYSNSYDAQGLLTGVTVNNTYVHKYNNEVQSSENYNMVAKITCVKKQQ